MDIKIYRFIQNVLSFIKTQEYSKFEGTIMTDVMLWSTYERFIWGIAITLTLISGVYFIIKGRKREIFTEKIIMFGLASLPLGFASSLIITFFQVLQIPGSLNIVNNVFYGDYDNFTPIYIILEIINNAVSGLTGSRKAQVRSICSYFRYLFATP